MKVMKNMTGVIRTCRSFVLAGVATALFASPAAAQGLEKARGVLEMLQDELTLIAPIAAAILLLAIGLAYAGRFLDKDSAVRWAIGVIIAGSAVEITALLFS